MRSLPRQPTDDGGPLPCRCLAASAEVLFAGGSVMMCRCPRSAAPGPGSGGRLAGAGGIVTVTVGLMPKSPMTCGHGPSSTRTVLTHGRHHPSRDGSRPACCGLSIHARTGNRGSPMGRQHGGTCSCTAPRRPQPRPNHHRCRNGVSRPCSRDSSIRRPRFPKLGSSDLPHPLGGRRTGTRCHGRGPHPRHRLGTSGGSGPDNPG